MRRTALIRRIPLKRGHWINKQSKKRAAENLDYSKQRDAHIWENPLCQVCILRDLIPMPSVQIHHVRSRIGSLLCDRRGFLATCPPCHEWIHAHPRDAREIGALAPARLWGTPFQIEP